MKNTATILSCALAALSQLSALHAAEPQDLVILRDSYKRALDRAVSPIQETYIGELQKLKTKYTRNDKLAEAVVVEKEIAKFMAAAKKDGGGEVPDTHDHLFGAWYCNDVETDVYLIKEGGKAFHAGDTGTWSADASALTITWENGFRLVIDLKQSEDTVFGKSYRPGAARYDLLKFTRQPEK